MPTPTTPVIIRYYPSLASILSAEDIPEILGFIRDGITDLVGRLHFKDFQYSKSPYGDAAFYALAIVSPDRIDIELPGTGIYLVLNPDYTGGDFEISSFPITVEYEWPILAYLNNFNLGGFTYDPMAIFDLGLRVINVSEEFALANYIDFFVTPINPSTTKLQQFVNDINADNPGWANPIPLPTSQTQLSDIVAHIQQESGINASLVAFNTYLYSDDIDKAASKVEDYFSSLIPSDVRQLIREIVTPKFRATLNLNAAIEFPRSILQPVYDENGVNPYDISTAQPERALEVIPADADGNPKVLLSFGQALFFADSQEGFGYNMEMVLNTITPAQIGKTGLIIDIHNLKIDLSRTKNIVEAEMDNRPPEFVGAYIDHAEIFLPKKWFKKETGQTLAITADRFLVGTGGISGTIGLRTTYATNAQGIATNFYQDYFQINFPVTVLSTGTPIEIISYTTLLAHINGLSQQSRLKFRYPFSITPNSGGGNVVFNSEREFYDFINAIDTGQAMWFRLGGNESRSWRLGFKSFDITFDNNQVTGSRLHAQLEMKKFKQGADEIAVVDLYGEWKSAEDFKLAASFLPGGLPLNLFDMLIVTFQGAEIGRDGGDFFIGADTKISFPEGTLANSLFNNQVIDLPAIRFYFDGRFEIVGGNAFIPVNFTLPIGPIKMSVTGIHIGSIQRERGGRMRKYNYIGFDGGMNIDPIGVDIRGKGVKYYYTIDNDEDEGNSADDYFHISTLELDLVIPGGTDPSEAVAIIKGSLTIPEPGVSSEYSGKISLQLPQLSIYGEAAMRLDPKYPAYLLDTSVEFPVPIPLGFIGIFGFRGLLGYRYVAAKEAINMTEDNTWYEYYMAPQRGINYRKFIGPQHTPEYDSAFSIGIGASIATMDGGGRTASLRAMILLSLPSMFAIDAGLTILSERIGMAEDDPTMPPFYAFVIIGDDSIEFGAGANFQFNKSAGWLLDIRAEIQAGFFFKNQRPWYINFGTRQNPITATLFKDILSIRATSYLMLSAAGIEAGSRVEFDFDFFIAKLHASLEVGGYISFERPQIGGYMRAEGSLKVDFWIINVRADVMTYFSVELPKPFLIFAEIRLRVCGSLKLGFVRVTICIPLTFTLKWEKIKALNTAAIPPITYLPVTDPDYAKVIQVDNYVKGIHMMTFETFKLDYLGVNLTQPPSLDDIVSIIPLDTYIDIKMEKGTNPSAVSGKIGGHTGGATKFIDLIPPQVQQPGGRTVRQVKHKYSIEEIEIMALSSTGQWMPYHPFKAILPDENVEHLKIGFWQKNSSNGQYDTIRLLATNPFSFLDGAEPGWFTPENYGITPSTLFCSFEEIEKECCDVLNKPLNKAYFPPAHYPAHQINGAYFNIKGYFTQTIYADPDMAVAQTLQDAMIVQDVPNPHNFQKSLVFYNYNTMVITLPKPTVVTELLITTAAQGVTIRYFRLVIVDGASFPSYELISEVYKPSAELAVPVVYDNMQQYDSQLAVSRVEITPDSANGAEILHLQGQMEELMVNAQEDIEGTSTTTLVGEDLAKYEELYARVEYLKGLGCSQDSSPCNKDKTLCELYERLLQRLKECFLPFTVKDIYKYCEFIDCFREFIQLIEQFDKDHGEYKLISEHIRPEYEKYREQLEQLMKWCAKPDVGAEEVYEYYSSFVANATSVVGIINALGDCDCNDEPCQRDERLCNLYAELQQLQQECYLALTSKDIYKYCDKLECFSQFIKIIESFDKNSPEYELLSTHIRLQYERYKEQIQQLGAWCSRPEDSQTALDYYNAFLANTQSILDVIAGMGDCNCSDNGVSNCTTSFQSICWISLEHYEYLQTIPSQDAIQADSAAMIEGFQRTVQPVWRPNTAYYVRFRLKDEVADGQYAAGDYNYYYGFRTVGPIGHFHRYPGAYQIPEGSVPEEYPIASLSKYIDYKRSYPNADGNLLKAKPLFYGNEQSKINIYFDKPFAYHMLNTWNAYEDSEGNILPERKGKMHIAIKDPVSDVIIPYPLPANWEGHESVPETVGNGENGLEWQGDNDPRIPLPVQILNNYISSIDTDPNIIPCQIVLGDPIQPASYYFTVKLENLKPQKLYTALVYNAFDQNNDGDIADYPLTPMPGIYEESQQVHQFVFQTSRYASFEDQVGSYILRELDDEGNVLAQKPAVFELPIELTQNQVDNAYAIISGNPNSQTDAMATQFYHFFDRVLEGVFGLSPLNPPMTTDFNKVRNRVTGNIIALLVRNPEPFNDPKIPLDAISNTVQVLTGGSPDPAYKVLYSKDYSQVLLMHTSKVITSMYISVRFKYKLWNGNSYDETIVDTTISMI
ncbi:hypothetical protein [Flavobacterium sp.]|uniref:hypothetical protein n=1 Tax=Flavobacterium sp. TaxID=239 RepID=UPI004034966B